MWVNLGRAEWARMALLICLGPQLQWLGPVSMCSHPPGGWIRVFPVGAEAFLAGGRKGPCAPACPSSLLAPCLLLAHWPKQVTWSSPASGDSEKDQTSQCKDQHCHAAEGMQTRGEELVASSVIYYRENKLEHSELESVSLF